MEVELNLVIFIVGCIGAAAPEIVRLYKKRLIPLKFPTSYYLVSILFFFLGGFVAIILPTITLWGAFYAGVGLPSIISGSLGKVHGRPLGKALRDMPRRKASIREYLGLLWS